MLRTGVLLSIAISLCSTVAGAATNQFRGVNWADSRDNFQSGVVYVSGLSSSDTYSSALATGTSVMTQFVSQLGANAVRMPINEATVSGYWGTYTGAIDAVLSKGSVVLCYWDSARTNKPPDMNAFWNMWKTVVDKYGVSNNAYFEIFNEPNMYSSSDLISLYSSWLTKFPAVPQSRVILDGTGDAQNVPNIGSASALNGCLLAVHDYSFFGSDTWTSESQWASQFKGEVGNYADRTVCTEWGGPMSPGSKNGVSYGSLDYSRAPTNYFEAYIRGTSNQLRAWNMGSFYWAGLKDGDWYSMATRSGTGSKLALSVPNPSGLAQLQNAWTSGGASGGGAGSAGQTGHAGGAGGTIQTGAGGIGGATLGSGGIGGSAGASSGGYSGSSAGAGETGGASDGLGGTIASAGGRQGSFGGTGGTGGDSSPTSAEGDSSNGCSCTTAGGSRHRAGVLTCLIFAAFVAARRRKSRQARGAQRQPMSGSYLGYRIVLAASIAVLGFSGTGCSSNGSPMGTGAGGGATGGGGGAGERGTGGSGTGGATSGGSLGSGGVVASGGAADASAGAAGGAGRGAGGAAGNTGGAGGDCQAPSATGELVTSLAGTWTFTPSGATATTIVVPGGGWFAQGFRSTNEANYQRMATVPNLGRAQATYLEFGAINHQATLTVDSTTVGTQTTSFTPSVWDVTSVVKPGMSHSFTVDVKGRNALKGSSGKKLVPDAAGWSSNVPQGIFRSAILHVVPALHVFETLVRTDVAADQFSIDVWVKNDGASAATGTVDVGLSSWTCDGTSYPSVPSKPVSVLAGQTVKVTLGPITWGLGAASYWWPNVPYVQGYRAKLHVARVTVTPDAAGGGAVAAHSIPVRFGFRQSRQITAHYELNGVPIKFRGDNIQGADYDSIKTAGAKDKSDAYDLFPGFLPPSANNPGWPQAVDNLQRLNFNVARLHQEPVSPYMLDVMDEMGMMVIDESAIRGSNNDQDFQAGSANMIAHVSALVHRDRNHPSVIRWSQCNEPEGDNTNSSAFQQQLYQAMVAADDTRPVSADASGSGPNIMNGYGVTAANFAVFEHYPSGFGSYTHDVAVSTTHPYGDGEFIWPADNSAQGLMWFATSTVTLRQKDPSDIRPYTLLSSWASFVPGVKSNMMSIEQGGPPLYTEDNLPMPWSNPIITRVQRAFNPVAVIDTAYWDANHASDKSGAWPISKPAITKGSQVSRQLMVFNDTLSGTSIDVSWEMHQDSASGAMSSQGTKQLDISLGGHGTITAVVTAPATGTTAVLVLRSSKNGTMLFEDDGEAFALQ